VRLWRTLGIANRLIALGWLVIVVLAFASYLELRPTTASLIEMLVVLAVFAIPSLLLWVSADRIESAEPAWLRSVVLIELAFVVVFTLGLALVPLLVIFLLAGDGAEAP
jgi:prepilin-type N-terminal cleavage/methylation domain-containing protein